MSLFPRPTYGHFGINPLQPGFSCPWHDVAWQGAELAAMVRINSYSPRLNAAVGWLPAVSSRIRNSVAPTGLEEQPSTEWLNKAAASAAIEFFDAAADLLPSEPHIYATHSGDLVAEFDAGIANLTAVISEDEIILFAAKWNSPPSELILNDCSKLREEVRAFTREI